jgi:hypothetical protein
VLASGALLVIISTAGAQAQLVAAFDWSMPARYGADVEPADGVVDAFDDPARISPPRWRVDFDACASSGPIASYRWSIDGMLVNEVAACNEFSYEFPAEGSYTVTLEVIGAASGRSTVTRPVVVQDWLIIGLGDSYGSGEGNPDVPITAADLDQYFAAVTDLETAQATLDAATARARQAQERAADLIQQGLEVQRRVATLEQRLRERSDACSFPLSLACAQAIARVASATANLLEVLIPLGLQALIDNPGSIEAAIQARIEDAFAELAIARAAAADAATLRDAARARVGEARAALRATWQDRRCHRSARSAQALAAQRIEDADPRTSVTFVHLACSGGRITAGVLEEDAGIDSPPGAPPIPPQLRTADLLRGRREIDAIVVSVGGNDLGFSKILQSCMAEDPCHDPPTTLDTAVPLAATLICAAGAIGPSSAACFDYFANLHDATENAKQIFEAGIASLPRLYARLDGELRTLLPELPAQRVYFTEYPNLTRDEQGNLCAFDPLHPLAMLPGITHAEAAWAEGVATVSLNDAIATATAEHGWTYVGGIFDDSTPHGYCSADPWLVRLQQSFLTQGDVFGTIHPNAAGHSAAADLISAALQGDFYVGGDLSMPRLPAPVTPCPGDCNGDDEVTIDELILGVAIGLELEDAGACPALDPDGDGAVTIDELLQAVGAALTGC